MRAKIDANIQRLSVKELVFCYKVCCITDKREEAEKIKKELHRRYPKLECVE
jgi:hypothetical protein